jgi:hypothetical protein
LRLRAVALLPKSSYIEIALCSEVVFRRMSYFVFEELIVDVSITINLLRRAVQIGIACRVHLTIVVVVVEKALRVGVARTVGIIVDREVTFLVSRLVHCLSYGLERG